MPLELACPGCQKMLRAHDGLLGGDALCPFCRKVVNVPGEAAAVESEAVSDIMPAGTDDLVENAVAQAPVSQPVVTPAAEDDEAPLMPPTFDPVPEETVPQPVVADASAVAEPVLESAPAADAESMWWAQTADGQQYGPVPKSELDSWVADGSINAECQILREGDAQWQWASQLYDQLR